MTRSIYNSRQDFSTQMAVLAKPFQGGFRLFGRTLASENQTQFENYLHDAMGWKSSTVNDWQF